ncbi:methyl-accepting chemotaxis protein [Acuticoccus sp. MNP-M23]|uniref:methyl-accepting chemotaxis protein n=1 Tax=Acuticoccus sp. MNP-M23 TaxID=3072793 RepID=UPI002814ABF0|nr:methyl-accepting chemotaxis protein [Acuticoccus sp. MNP-M23]WMS44366.1 methyl-accepting chemotaxis protein [Acuticoccus sp. MNP-M23]
MREEAGQLTESPLRAPADEMLCAARARFARALIVFFWAHPPIVLAVSLGSGQPLGATIVLTVLASAIAGAAQFARWRWGVEPTARHVSAACGIALTGVLIAAASGTPYQNDMHMYVVVMVGVMIGWCDFKVFITTTAVVAAGHLAVNVVAPHFVFSDGAAYIRLPLHGAIVLVQVLFLVPATRWLAAALHDAEASGNAARAQAAAATRELEANFAAEKHRQAAISDLILDFRKEADNSAQAVVRETGAMDKVARMLTEITADGQEKLEGVRGSAEAVEAEVGTARAASNTMTGASRNIRGNIDGAVLHMADVMRQTEESAEAVRGLVEASNEMNGILDVIRSVSEQTSLLALNATIEAARAGEAGKSFAVVAAEVKGLAEQSGKATDTIASRLTALGNYTEEVVEKIRRIGQSAAKVNESSSAVLGAVEEQTEASTAMEHSLSEVASSVDRSIQSVEVLSGVMDSGAQAAGRVDEVARSVSTLSHAMHQAIAMLLANVEKHEAGEGPDGKGTHGYLDPDAPAQMHFPSHANRNQQASHRAA